MSAVLERREALLLKNLCNSLTGEIINVHREQEDPPFAHDARNITAIIRIVKVNAAAWLKQPVALSQNFRRIRNVLNNIPQGYSIKKAFRIIQVINCPRLDVNVILFFCPLAKPLVWLNTINLPSPFLCRIQERAACRSYVKNLTRLCKLLNKFNTTLKCSLP